MAWTGAHVGTTAAYPAGPGPTCLLAVTAPHTCVHPWCVLMHGNSSSASGLQAMNFCNASLWR